MLKRGRDISGSDNSDIEEEHPSKKQDTKLIGTLRELRRANAAESIFAILNENNRGKLKKKILNR